MSEVPEVAIYLEYGEVMHAYFFSLYAKKVLVEMLEEDFTV